MDPVSYLFSAYLNLVQQQVTDIYGTEVKALVVPYEGEQVPFSYQLWQIKQNSVCRPYEQDVRRFSQCTVKAQALFGSCAMSCRARMTAVGSSLSTAPCTARLLSAIAP